jgi:hypothetical protein
MAAPRPAGGLPLGDASPDFDTALATAAAENAWLRREATELAGAGRAAARALSARVDAPRGRLSGLLGALGGGKDGARKEPPPVDAFLADALTDLGDDSDLSGPLATQLGVDALHPLAEVLKARAAACAFASQLEP